MKKPEALRQEVNLKIKELDNTPYFLQRKNIINAMSETVNKIKQMEQSVQKLIKEGKFEEATELKLSMAAVETKKLSLQKEYDLAIISPKYTDSDIAVITAYIVNEFDTAAQEAETEIKQLCMKMIELNKAESDLYHSANHLISLARALSPMEESIRKEQFFGRTKEINSIERILQDLRITFNHSLKYL